jgi:protein SCO1/2
MRRTSAVVLFVALLLLAGCGEPRPELNGTLLTPPMPADDFTLTSANGPVQASDFAGKLVVLAFGYASCPDVCPMTMQRLARAMERLGPAADDVQVLLVTVDPERDTPERLGAYVSTFDSTFVGLSGTTAEIDAVTSSFGIFYDRAETTSASGYLVDHSSVVTVLNREGDAWLLWPFNTTPEAMAADLDYLIKAS